MAKVSINISIDEDTKAQAQALLDILGMDLSTAVNIFLKQLVRDNAFPFHIQNNTPNVDDDDMDDDDIEYLDDLDDIDYD